jgi:hypothetical protein
LSPLGFAWLLPESAFTEPAVAITMKPLDMIIAPAIATAAAMRPCDVRARLVL